MAVPTRIDSFIIQSGTEMFTSGSINHVVETPSGALYIFYKDSINSDPSFKKSVDGGMTWGTATVLKACTMTQISVWYDRWSGINADLIHVAYTDSGADDVFYRNIDTANADALSTEYTVFAGASTANGGALSISRMRGGNLIVCGCIDAGDEEVNRKSTDVGANWTTIANGYEDASAGDLCIVMPGWGADNQDAMMFYYDRSATEISVKYYDDSGDSWSETSIATSIALPDHTTTTLGHMSAAVDLTNSQNLICFWTAVDLQNADLRCFKVTQSAQTETASNVVLNSGDDQAFAAISININTEDWYVFYFGKSDGSETYNTIINIYYKISVDDGANWGSETLLGTVTNYNVVNAVYSKPRYYKNIGIAFLNGNQHRVMYNAPLSISHANYQLGM